MKVMIKCFVITFILGCFAFSCKQVTHDGQMFVKAVPFKTTQGWGYEIYADNKLYIRQVFIPGVSGRHSFINREDAQKTGDLILKKMAVKQTLPSVSRQELIQLHIQLPD